MVLNLNFILGFVGISVALMIGLMLFSEVSDAAVSPINPDDVNCHVNYDHNINCEQQIVVFNGEKDNSFWIIALLPLALVGFIVGRRLF